MLRRLTITLLALTVAAATLPAPAHAQADSAAAGAPAAIAPASMADPLAGIVAEALHANLGLGQERMAERRAAADVRAARALLLPDISIEARRSHFENVVNIGDLVNPAYAALNQLTGTNAFPTNIDLTFPYRYESHLRLVQPLINEPLRANLAVASARHDGQRMALATAARQVAAEAQTAYLQQASARRVVGIYEATLTIVRENERVSERLLAAGTATPEAVQRARAERAEVEQELAEARERSQAATRAFNLVLQRPLDAPVEDIPDSLFDVPLGVTVDDAVRRGLAGREELRQVDAGVRTAEAAKRAATTGLLPSVAGVLDYGYQGNDVTFQDADHIWTASLALTWSVFNGGGDLARRSAAGYEAARAKLARKDLEDKVALEIRTAYQAAVVAHDAIATADVRLEAASRTFTLTRRRYEEGAASPYELVDARASLTNAQLNRVLTAYRYALRRVDLERAAALRDIELGKGASR
ncbi:MAG: TolC family protein [Hyphomicrobiales bacterium]